MTAYHFPFPPMAMCSAWAKASASSRRIEQRHLITIVVAYRDYRFFRSRADDTVGALFTGGEFLPATETRTRPMRRFAITAAILIASRWRLRPGHRPERRGVRPVLEPAPGPVFPGADQRPRSAQGLRPLRTAPRAPPASISSSATTRNADPPHRRLIQPQARPEQVLQPPLQRRPHPAPRSPPHRPDADCPGSR